MFDRAKLLPSNLPGVFALPPIPNDFDPNTATKAALLKHGLLWRRPAQHDHPAVIAAWNKAFSGGFHAKKHIVPSITPLANRIHKPVILTRPFDGPCAPSDRWSGAVVNNPWPGWTGNMTVTSYWRVPTVSMPTWPGNRGLWTSSSWIGIGNPDPNKVPTDLLLQAGVTHDVIDLSGTTKYYAWYAYDFEEHRLNDIMIRPGDEISSSVQYLPQSHQFYFSIYDSTTGQYSAMLVDLPKDREVATNTVEWIVEVPGGYINGNAIPNITPVRFDSAIGCNGEVVFATDGGCIVTVDKRDGKDVPVTQVAFESSLINTSVIVSLAT